MRGKTKLAALHNVYWSFDRWYRWSWYIWPVAIALLIIGWICVDKAGGQTLTSALWGTPIGAASTITSYWPEKLQADARRCFSNDYDLEPLIEACSRLIESEDANSGQLFEGYAQRGFHRKLRHPDLAMDDYNAALNIRPDSAAVLTNRGWIYLTRGEYDAALADLNRAVELFNPKQAGRARYYRGYALLRLKDYPRALSDLNAAQSLHFEAEVRLVKGEILQNLQLYDKAMYEYNAYVQSVAVDPRGHVGRGSLLEATGRPREALLAYDRALMLDPKNPNAIAGRDRVRAALPQ